MNDKLIEKLISYLESTENFVYEQAPDFIQQLLAYEKLSSIVGTFISGIVMFFCIFLAIYHIYNPEFEVREYNSGNRTLLSQMLCFMPLLLAIPFFGQFLQCVANWIKMSIAPKVFLLEYMMKLKG